MKTKHLLAIILLLLTGRMAFAAAPTITSFSPSNGPVGTVVIVRGSNLSGQTAFTIGGMPALVITNNGTKIVGMVMPGAVTGAISLTTSGGTANGSVSFTLKDNLAPTTPQGGRLSASYLAGNSRQGAAVAISANGMTAIIGGPGDNNGAGAAWIYKLRGSSWILQTNRLSGTGMIGQAAMGQSVSVSADGNTAIVGGAGDNGGAGAAWIYIRNPDSTWVQQGVKLTGINGVGTQIHFGSSVSLNADGNTAIIGGYGDDNSKGAAWIFTRTGTTWAQQGSKLIGTDASTATNTFSGWAVALSADGNTAAVGGYGDGAIGAVWVYTRNGTSWTQQGAKLTPSGVTDNISFGYAVAVSADGNTIMAGAPNDSTYRGAAWVFNRSGNAWAQYGNKISGPGTDYKPYFGSSISLTADGKNAAIGAPQGLYVGGVYLFSLTDNVWTQQGSKIVSTDAIGNASQGTSVSICANGLTMLIGGPQHKAGKGAVWAFIGTAKKTQTITFAQPATVTYGVADINPAAKSSSALSVILTSNNPSVATIVAGKIHITGGGTATITAQQNGNTVYLPAPQVVRTITVNKTPLTVTADDKLTPVGDALPALTYTYTGFKNGDTEAYLATPPVITTIATTASPIGDYAITINGAVSASYNFTYVGATLRMRQAPIINSFSPASGPAGTLVTLKGKGLLTPTAFTAGGVPALIISSTDSLTVIRVMAGAVTGNITAAILGSTNIAPGLFSVTDTGGPNTQQGQYLAGTLPAGTSMQGTSVGVSADGKTVIVGGPNDNSLTGAAWIYKLSGSNWKPQSGKLVGTQSNLGTHSNQGVAVAISGDGNTAIVGGPIDNVTKGAVWIYARQADSTWVQQGDKIVIAGAPDNVAFGSAVALSADGNTAAIGGYYDNNYKGAIYVFVRTGTTWAQQAKLVATIAGVTQPRFGYSLAISDNGNTIIGSAINLVYDPNTQQQYSATLMGCVFIRTGTTWAQKGNVLTASGSNIGYSYQQTVSLSGDGYTAMLASSEDDGKGAVWAFSRSVFTWTQVGNKLFYPVDAVGRASFGTGISLSPDGKTAAIGGKSDNSDTGAAWIYKLIDGGWVQQGGKLVGNGFSGLQWQGTAVALSRNGNTVISGGPRSNSGIGATWAFTYGATPVSASPVVTSFSPAFGQAGTLVTVTGSNLANLTAFNIGTKPAIVISNTGTKLVGMVMPGAQTGTVTVSNTGGTGSAPGSFSVISAALPNTAKGGRISAPDIVGASAQGISVAVSADGNSAIVGGYTDNNNNIGAAWIYKFIEGAWTVQGNKLTGTGAIGAAVYQGKSVAISADGGTALVGGFGDNGGVGAAWIYTLQADSSWQQQGTKLTGGGAVGAAGFGYSVALSADGNTAVISGYHDDGSKGATWIFTRSGNSWVQQGTKLFGTGGIGLGSQGSAVAISADGNTAMISAFNDNGGIGAAWIFTRGGTTWAQQGNKLTGTGFTGTPHMGFGVSLSADGNTAMAGGPADNTNMGAAWVFTRSGTTWSQFGNKITSASGIGAPGFAKAVSLSADGKTAAIGAYQDNSNAGATWIYKLVSGAWAQQGGKLFGADAVGAAMQGISVAISADGTTVLTGGSQHKTGKGAAWAFAGSSPVIGAVSPSSGPIGTLVTINGTGLAGSTSITIGGVPAILTSVTDTKLQAMVMPGAANGDIIISGNSASVSTTGVYTITNAGAPVNQQGDKFYPYNLTSTEYGDAVAINANGTTAVVGNPYNDFYDGGAGASGVFNLKNGNWITQPQKLIGTGNRKFSRQGASLAISADGNTILMGGPEDNNYKGAIWIFERKPDSIYAQLGSIIVPTDGIGQVFFGGSAALSADGRTAVISGTNDNNSTGAIWVFVRTANIWAQQGTKLVGTGIIGQAHRIMAVNISADGNTIIVGSPSDNNDTGAVWIYKRSGNTWLQQGAKLIGTGSTGALFGCSVALSADGNTALVGAYYDNNYQGAAYIYTRLGDTWTQYGSSLTTINTQGGNLYLGFLVSLSADGKTAALGCFEGGTYIFKLVNNVWIRQSSLLLGTDLQGSRISGRSSSLAISSNGLTLLSGISERSTAVAFYGSESQIITFPPPAGVTNSGNVNLAAKSSSGLPITYTSSNQKVAVVVDGKVRVVGRGTAIITATQPGNKVYAAAEPVTRTLTINRNLTPNSLQDITGPIVDPALSPNGDGKNDVLTITNIEMYPDNKISIINTNGDGIFEATGYNNQSKAFDGTSTIDGKKQKPGTYYYRLEYKDNGVLKSKTGYIVIKY